MEKTKEAYIDYLVRKVSEGVSSIIDEKFEKMKNDFLNIEYESALEKTEVILKKYSELKKHVELTMLDSKELEDETSEIHSKEIEQMMTEIFSESESYLKSLLRSRYKTKAFVCFIEKVINNYLKQECYDAGDSRRKKLLCEIYINGAKQSDFILDNYDSERTYYKDRTRLIKDLAPYFFGIKGIEI